MGEFNDNNNGRVEYGKLIQKVDDIQNMLNEQRNDVKNLTVCISKLENRETNGCDYSHEIEKRVRIIEDWKNNLSGRIYIFLTFAIITDSISRKPHALACGMN